MASACIHNLSYPPQAGFRLCYLLLGMFKGTRDLNELTVDSIIYIGEGNLARLVYAFECTSLRYQKPNLTFTLVKLLDLPNWVFLLQARYSAPLRRLHSYNNSRKQRWPARAFRGTDRQSHSAKTGPPGMKLCGKLKRD